VLAEGLAERPGLRTPALVHIALGRTVVDPEPRRVTVAGRRTTVADQSNVTSADERGPGGPLFSGRPRRRHDQRRGKHGDRQEDNGSTPRHECHSTNAAERQRLV
jgi:hypothetical protein